MRHECYILALQVTPNLRHKTTRNSVNRRPTIGRRVNFESASAHTSTALQSHLALSDYVNRYSHWSGYVSPHHQARCDCYFEPAHPSCLEAVRNFRVSRVVALTTSRINCNAVPHSDEDERHAGCAEM